MTIIKCFEIDTGKKGIPKWIRLSFIKDGVVYIPFPNELFVTMTVIYDCLPLIIEKGHLSAPVNWFAQEFPKHAELFRHIEKIIREHDRRVYGN